MIEDENRLLEAIRLYEAEEVSMGKAARAAGMSTEAFMEALGANGIACIRYEADDLAEEVEESFEDSDKGRIDVIEDHKRSIRDRVEKLAHDHDVHYVETDLDALAEVVTRLADDNIVKFDATEQLILALGRAGVIDSARAVSLFVEYLKEGRSGPGAGPC